MNYHNASPWNHSYGLAPRKRWFSIQGEFPEECLENSNSSYRHPEFIGLEQDPFTDISKIYQEFEGGVIKEEKRERQKKVSEQETERLQERFRDKWRGGKRELVYFCS